MKKLELEPSKENLLETMRVNAIGRNDQLFDFLNFIDEIEEATNISIDGDWGSGKTFFVKQIIMLLNHYRIKNNNDNSNSEGIITDLPQPINEIEMSNSFLTVYYDAWLYDDHIEPLLSLIYAIINSSKTIYPDLINKPAVGKRIGALIEAVASIFSIEISLDKVLGKPESYTQQIDCIEEIKNLIKELFDELINENADKLVIVIDELDRCNPSYAVKILEKVKHFFEDDRVIFIFSTNKNQLIHTIEKYYGTNFNATKYLNRFFDYQFSVKNIDTERYLRFIEPSNNPMSYIVKMIKEIGNYYHFSMREFNIYNQKVKLLSKSFKCEIMNGMTLAFIAFGLPLCALSIIDIEKEREFLSGNLCVEITKLYENVDIYKKIIDRFIAEKSDGDFSFIGCLQNFYDFIFCLKERENRDDFETNKIEFWYTERGEFIDKIRK